MTKLQRRKTKTKGKPLVEDGDRGMSLTPAPTPRTKHLPITQDIWDIRIAEARAMAYAGATNVEIADWFGVAEKTLYHWGTMCPGFLEALAFVSDHADNRVEKKLYNSAMEGNVSAQIFWLKNRRTNKWRDRRDIELNAEIETTGEVNYRHQAMALIALMREAADDNPVIEGEIADETEGHKEGADAQSNGEQPATIKPDTDAGPVHEYYRQTDGDSEDFVS